MEIGEKEVGVRVCVPDCRLERRKDRRRERSETPI
jgi:hypothetical protein